MKVTVEVDIFDDPEFFRPDDLNKKCGYLKDDSHCRKYKNKYGTHLYLYYDYNVDRPIKHGRCKLDYKKRKNENG